MKAHLMGSGLHIATFVFVFLDFVTLEEEFDIEIPDDEAEKIQTVADVVAYVESK